MLFAVSALVQVIRDRRGKGFWTVMLTLLVGMGLALLGGFIGFAAAAIWLSTYTWGVCLVVFVRIAPAGGARGGSASPKISCSSFSSSFLFQSVLQHLGDVLQVHGLHATIGQGTGGQFGKAGHIGFGNAKGF